MIQTGCPSLTKNGQLSNSASKPGWSKQFRCQWPTKAISKRDSTKVKQRNKGFPGGIHDSRKNYQSFRSLGGCIRDAGGQYPRHLPGRRFWFDWRNYWRCGGMKPLSKYMKKRLSRSRRTSGHNRSPFLLNWDQAWSLRCLTGSNAPWNASKKLLPVILVRGCKFQI